MASLTWFITWRLAVLAYLILCLASNAKSKIYIPFKVCIVYIPIYLYATFDNIFFLPYLRNWHIDWSRFYVCVTSSKTISTILRISIEYIYCICAIYLTYIYSCTIGKLQEKLRNVLPIAYQNIKFYIIVLYSESKDFFLFFFLNSIGINLSNAHIAYVYVFGVVVYYLLIPNSTWKAIILLSDFWITFKALPKIDQPLNKKKKRILF